MSRHLRQFSYFLALGCNLELPLGWSVLLACQIVLGDHSKKYPFFSQRIHLYSHTTRHAKMCTKIVPLFGTEFGPAKVDSATKNLYGSLFHAGGRTPTSIPQEGRPSWYHARAGLDRPWDPTCHASQQVLRRVGASAPSARVGAPLRNPSPCPNRPTRVHLSVQVPRKKCHFTSAARYPLQTASAQSCKLAVLPTGLSVVPRGWKTAVAASFPPPPPLPRGDTACTISLVSAGVCNGRCVRSPGLDGIRRALQQRCATAQQLESTCKSDENHVETMQKEPKTKFMAIKRRFTRVLKTKTDGPPSF